MRQRRGELAARIVDVVRHESDALRMPIITPGLDTLHLCCIGTYHLYPGGGGSIMSIEATASAGDVGEDRPNTSGR